jgi:methyl-accepting chemotaxis protein
VNAQDVATLVVAGSIAVIALAFISIALSARSLSREARDLARDGDRLVTMLREELPKTIQSVEELSGSLRTLSVEVQPRLKRLDKLADEADATLVSLREASDALAQLARGPADTVVGVKKSVRAVGEGLASGADRLRRAVSRED